MAALSGLIFGGVGGAIASLFSKPKAPTPQPVPTRDMATEEAMKRDTVARRRGAAANALLGASGAESGTGGKTALGT